MTIQPDQPPEPRLAVRLLVVVVALLFPLVQLVKTVIDRATTIRDATGTVHFVSDGRAAQILLLGGTLTAAGIGAHLLLRSLRRGTFVVTHWAMLAFLLLAGDILRRRVDPLDLVYGALTVVVILAAGVLRVRSRDLAAVGVIAGLTSVSNLAFAAINPERGWAECRSDKCSLAGGLLRGYFPQENVLGMFLASLLPAIAFIRSRGLRLGLLAAVVLGSALTGSRTSMAALLLGLWAYVVIRRRDGKRHNGDAAKVVGFFPLMAFAVSTVLLFTLSEMALTGRGLIYRIVRESWYEHPLLGPGREALYDAYYASMANWFLSHEHGEAAYVIGNAGVAGYVVAVLALAGIAVACWRSRGPLPAAFALVPALGFLTEPTWELSVRSAYLASLYLTVVLVAMTGRGEPAPVPDDGAVQALASRNRATLAAAAHLPGRGRPVGSR